LWLVVELPDGGETSVEVGDTDVVNAAPLTTTRYGATVLTCEGARRLLGLLEACLRRTTTDAMASGVRMR
jgi:hypothetical protein